MFPRVLIALGLGAASAAAQVPGAPVLQNAFTSQGIALAANFGGGSGTSYFGAAAAWGPGSGRFQVSGAAGAERAHGTTRGAYGARAAMGVWTSSGGALGVGAFAGVGGGPQADSSGIVANPETLTIPAGVSVGYRRPMGRTRGIAVYASPFYRWTRLTAGPFEESTGRVRVSLGLDFAFTASLGITAGTELGQSSGRAGMPNTFGAAATYALGR